MTTKKVKTQSLRSLLKHYGIRANKLTIVFKLHKVSAVIRHEGKDYAASAKTDITAVKRAIKRMEVSNVMN